VDPVLELFPLGLKQADLGPYRFDLSQMCLIGLEGRLVTGARRLQLLDQMARGLFGLDELGPPLGQLELQVFDLLLDFGELAVSLALLLLLVADLLVEGVALLFEAADLFLPRLQLGAHVRRALLVVVQLEEAQLLLLFALYRKKELFISGQVEPRAIYPANFEENKDSKHVVFFLLSNN